MGFAALLAGCTTVTPAPVAPTTAPPAAAAPGAAQTAAPAGPLICGGAMLAAAQANAQSLNTSPWMFSAGTDEKPEGPGWALYVPAIMRTLGTACGPDSAGFAQALGDWQRQQGLSADGMMGRDTAAKLKESWQARRAHLTRPACIELQKADAVPVPADAIWDDSERRLQSDALNAYRQMFAAAKAAHPEFFAQRGLLLVASAWRDPADDKASCTANPGPCNGTAKAVTCSAHWSGRAVDLNLGFIAGSDPTDSTYANRLHQSKSAAYAWMLDNAARFGFVNYYYEPWHWEWQGDSATPPATR